MIKQYALTIVCLFLLFTIDRRVWRYQRGNQNL